MMFQETFNNALWHAMADDYHKLIKEVNRRTFRENEALDEIGNFVLERGKDFPVKSRSEIEIELNEWIISLKEKYYDK